MGVCCIAPIAMDENIEKPRVSIPQRSVTIPIKMLNITEEEMEELLTIISKDEKRRRDREKKRIERAKRREKEGLTAKQRELKELREEIKKLRKEGYSIRMIGKKLGVSASKVQRNMKE